MKEFILLITVFCFIFLGCSEQVEREDISSDKAEIDTLDTSTLDSLQNITRLEKFLSKKGILIVKDFYELGKIKGRYSTSMNMTGLVFYEPGNEQFRIKGLKVEVTQPTSYSERSETAFLDVEELESLSEALDYMYNLINEWKDTTREYTEVIFETKGNFKCGFFQANKKVTIFSAAGYGSGVNCFLKSSEDIVMIKNKIVEAIKMLAEK